jgi:glycosyltransferase involved in cell wall biosynthesis
MRVLHVNAGNLYGGIETLLVTLARHRALCPEVDPEFALFFEGRLSGELRAANVPVHRLGEARVSRPWTVLRARRRLRELLRAGRFDAVVTHGCWSHAIAAPAARRRGVPLVFWAHNIQGRWHLLERWARWAPPDLVLANSRATEASVRANLFPSARTEVVYLPVAAPQLPDRAAVRDEVRRALLTQQAAVVIVTACRLEPWKGHGLLLDALGRLAKLPGWECWVAGGPQRPEEQDYFDGLRSQAIWRGIDNRVWFLGQRSDVGRLLAAADVHCQPNTAPEPFGIAFVEALYAGLPVVTTHMGGAVEIIREDCGVLVPPGDAGALAAALHELIGDAERRRRLGQRGPARAAELCDPARQLRKLQELLAAVTPDRGRATPSLAGAVA